MTLVVLLQCTGSGMTGNDGYRLWLKYFPVDRNPVFTSGWVAGESETCRIIRNELASGLSAMQKQEFTVSESPSEKANLIAGTPETSEFIKQHLSENDIKALGRDGYLIRSVNMDSIPVMMIAANTDIGLLYGTFALLRRFQTGADPEAMEVLSAPKIDYRLLNHWDNMNGSVERGYAGRSLWKWDELPDRVDPRYTDYARANASLGINGTVLNNVNANPQFLTRKMLEKIKVLADIFRPYGLRVFLSVNFSSPIGGDFEIESNRRGGIGNLKHSDPLDPEVAEWWKEKADEIYGIIPDFGGFLVKANSEGMPGPQEYNRTHADGANMLARALAPHGGIVMWRSVVYVADVDADRAKRAYLEFVPLDGQFEPNVFVQSKNGPIDFQPREPVSPIFGAMSETPMMLELQITQEYLGHSKHLVYLAPMWKEYLDFDTYAGGEGSTLASIIDGTLFHNPMTGIAGVANIGDDRNWTGHFFGQANWYAFGRLAWDHTLTAGEIADEWIQMTFNASDSVRREISDMMMKSREACVNYMTPLGLHHIMQAGFHYGPQPGYSQAPRRDWTSVYYHRADSLGIGFDRSSRGSNAVDQYFSPWKERFDNPETCPEKYLLWFHHLPWDFQLKSRKTLWEGLCEHYYAGTDTVDQMMRTWTGLEGKVDDAVYKHVLDRLYTQQKDAAIWRDTCLEYFQQFSRRKIEH